MHEQHEPRKGSLQKYEPPVLCDRGAVRPLTRGGDGSATETGLTVVWGNFAPEISDEELDSD